MTDQMMTYSGVGVDYDAMDPFKRMAQVAGRQTATNIERVNYGEFKEFEASRGESAYLIETSISYFAHVLEGLGTKNLVADAMYELTGKSYYDRIAQDTVATVVNDMITVGAMPLSVGMHLAAGSSDWFKDEKRSLDLVNGWKKACDLAGCVWGGGETPTLKDMIDPKTVVLSGSGIGIVKPKKRLIDSRNIQDKDAIILCESSGIGANGLTLARTIAGRKDDFWRKLGHLFFPRKFPSYSLPQGYLSPLPNGRVYGDTLLDPTFIYVSFVQECQIRGVNIHGAVNITGHGWRKLMRATRPFAYIIEELPFCPPIFDFIQKHGPLTDREAFGNLNMGAGFALYVPEKDVPLVLRIGQEQAPVNLSNYHHVFRAGHIEASDVKKVVILPNGLEYEGSTLGVR
jgi:phosphoribosylformylglycinamidine cyclo-ligase